MNWPPISEKEGIYTISELTAEIRTVLEESFAAFWVQGEISNFTVPKSGHYYFTLKDAGAQLRAVCFRGMQNRIMFQPRNGMEVLAHGRISVYEPRGEYQLIIMEMVDVGQGKLQLAFEQLKDKLKREGLFDGAHKKPLPLLPKRVGVVTSSTGAAIRDIIHVLRRRNSSVQVLLFPVKVQGEGAAEEIARGIESLNDYGGLDVIIVGRGGGSLEDLWAFNEEIVARSIHASRIPVISAVGHEVDFTIADFVADVRAPTPSAAAELVSAAAEELTAKVRNMTRALFTHWSRYFSDRRHRLQILRMSRGFTALSHRIATLIQKVDEQPMRMHYRIRQALTADEKLVALLSRRLSLVSPLPRARDQRYQFEKAHQLLCRALQDYLRGRRNGLHILTERLAGLNPRQVLARGYAVCMDEEGRLVHDAVAVTAGRRVAVRLHRGSLDCRVEESHPAGMDRRADE
ncbi:MAG: exodeoxyribonuclease VII large subunit [Acidobacteria bacterium]|nr:exodeoxyribonuclease VII large subunit [Acidobacteriota bacterium]